MSEAKPQRDPDRSATRLAMWSKTASASYRIISPEHAPVFAPILATGILQQFAHAGSRLAPRSCPVQRFRKN